MLVSSTFYASNTNAQVQTIKPVYQRLYTTLGGFYESLPVDYASQPNKKYPLLIFLHGAGEKGDGSPAQLPRVLRNGPPRVISQGKFPSKFLVNGQEFSFIVVAPQVNGSSGSNSAIGAMIEYCIKNYRVDEQRIYITGLSLGGLMTYNFVGYKKEVTARIAATLLVCPNAVSVETRANVIASSNLPVWLTNNDGDNAAKIGNATKTVNMINAYNPNPRVRFTIFNKVGHDAWTKTYDPAFKEDGKNVYEWMLGYTNKRNGSTSTPPPVVVAAPPVANAGADKIITLPLDSVVLTGSVSTTGTATIKTYQWNYAGGSSAPVIKSPSQKSTVVKTQTEGTYIFTLKVTDSNGNSDLDSVSVMVKPAPVKPEAPKPDTTKPDTTKPDTTKPGTTNPDTSKPDTVKPTPVQYLVANAGADQTIILPATAATLNASASAAGTGRTIAAYAWKKLSGPVNAGNVAAAKSIITSVTGFVPGTYTYQLTVTDNAGSAKMDTVKVTVQYTHGVLKADAGRDTTLILPQSFMPLNGSNSTAPAGSTVSAAWKRISGPGSSSAVMYPSSNLVTTASKPAAGTYVYQLTLRDEKKNQSTDLVTIVVKNIEEVVAEPIKQLTANAGANQAVTLPVNQAILDGSASFAGTNQTIASYAWKRLSGPVNRGNLTVANAAVTAVKDLVPGTYSYQLTVTDNAGESKMDTITVAVQYKNGVLKADAGKDTTLILPQGFMPLDGSNSTAPAGSSITAAWKRISGPGSSSAVMYPSSNLVTTAGRPTPGTYVYQLTLRDEKNNQSTDLITVVVKETGVSSRTASTVSSYSSATAAVAPANATAVNNNQIELSIKPNPVAATMYVQVENNATGNGLLKVFDLQGRLIKYKAFSKQSSGSATLSMEVSDLRSGAYILQADLNGTAQKAARFIKQ
ncbi:MAG: PKD domain-containing protein [Agriterribacter sp.]